VTHPAPSPAAPGKGSSQLTRSQSTIPIAESTRHPVPWRPGETLWGIQGTLLLFEDRCVRWCQRLILLLNNSS
jgi:hypothetical protein